MLFWLTGCSVPHAPQPFLFETRYVLTLSEVDSPEKNNAPYKVEALGNQTFSYEDGRLKAAFVLHDDKIALELFNKLAQSMVLHWDRASFVDIYGKSERVTHSGVKFVDASRSQPPSSIPPATSLADTIVPVSNITYRQPGYVRSGEPIDLGVGSLYQKQFDPGGWHIADLLPSTNEIRMWRDIDGPPQASEALKARADQLVGKQSASFCRLRSAVSRTITYFGSAYRIIF